MDNHLKMDFRLADTFTDALARLPAQDQKAVKVSVMDLQLDPSAPGLQMHRITASKDPNFWSARVNRDIRLILHKTGASLLVAYVDHHDAAYAWAERRRIETHPRTGAVQIVEVRERVEEAQPDLARWWTPEEAPLSMVAEAPIRFLFDGLDDEVLLGVGVPEEWLTPVRRTVEDDFFDLAEHLPREAAEALLEYASTGRLQAAVPAAAEANPFEHPDARRRFVAFDNADELAAALEAPWEKWSIFLHPTQREVVARRYNGPARATGSAGTGKTVVALHRTARALKSDPAARVLLTTFSEPLARHLQTKLGVLLAQDRGAASRATVASFEAVAAELYELAFALRPRLARPEQIEAALAGAAAETGLAGFSQRFLDIEWQQVVDPRRVNSAEAYAVVPRLGRKTRLGARQREALWPVFERARARLEGQGLMTLPMLFNTLADYFEGRKDKPFSHVVVDEAQDLGVAELRLMRAIAPVEGADRLFFAGDLGQRIFQQPFSWRELGVDLRGRSSTLKVNYRTSQQIREAADALLPASVRDVDGEEADRRDTISAFEGPSPEVRLASSLEQEQAWVAAFIREALEKGLAPEQIGLFVRSPHELQRARAAAAIAGVEVIEISGDRTEAEGRISIGVMHLAKGLEFRWVSVMACDDDVLPAPERVDAVIDQADLDDVYETERHLLYVACTRARDRLLLSGLAPGSEFLEDLRPGV
ncbi:3'-5' exonuclease [Brevundimonas aurantiaca]|uniref:3'-5' exonuclease n=2 Tax=Brevundimonas TaxID=41275 RepID=UPI0037BEE5D7